MSEELVVPVPERTPTIIKPPVPLSIILSVCAEALASTEEKISSLNVLHFVKKITISVESLKLPVPESKELVLSSIEWLISNQVVAPEEKAKLEVLCPLIVPQAVDLFGKQECCIVC